MIRRRPSAFIMVASVIAVMIGASACGSADKSSGERETGRREEGLRNLEEIASSERDYEIYWLGTGFTAGGMEYWGPDVTDPDDATAEIGRVEGGGLGMYYLSGSTCCGSLKLVVYSPDAWARVLDLRSRGAQATFDSRLVEINGHPAQLRTYRGTLNPVSAQTLIADFGGTVLEATTSAVVPPNPSASQPNPLIDEATFLAVMQNLRPYPE
jgi:hypothetical protein